jgi:hypothetical protein
VDERDVNVAPPGLPDGMNDIHLSSAAFVGNPCAKQSLWVIQRAKQ